jgi:hypothetical protein
VANAPDWHAVTHVVGTRTDYAHTGIRRACSRCGRAVYFAHRYPADVAALCEVCWQTGDAATPAAKGTSKR